MLATSDNQTYVLFLYDDIQWGNDETTIGLNSGDSFFILPESGTAEGVLNLNSTSNVATPGTYIFRVDQEQLAEIEGEYTQ